MTTELLMTLFLVTTICYILLLLRAIQLLPKHNNPISNSFRMPHLLKVFGWMLVLTGACISILKGFSSASSGPNNEPLLPTSDAGIIFLPLGLIIICIGAWLIKPPAKLFLLCLLLIGFSFISGAIYTSYRINWLELQEYWPDNMGLIIYYSLLFIIGPSLLWIIYNKKNNNYVNVIN